jgi:hypothetical protein
MDLAVPFLIVGATALVIALLLAFVAGRGRVRRRLTPLSGLALALIVGASVLGSGRPVDYGMLATGLVLAIADLVYRWKLA